MKLRGPVQTLDKDFRPLQVGDRVRFIMRGHYLPREQENFGVISMIDESGGITIEMVDVYKHFLTNKRIGDLSKRIYYTHHVYDRERHARVYATEHNGHQLFISQLNGE
ncbi:MAG: hypothetical protein AAB250_11315 [Bdellovibrionota bacterium]